MRYKCLGLKALLPVLIISIIAGCSPTTVTPAQAEVLVRDRYLGNYCASKGWIEDMSVAAAYMSAIEEKLAFTSPEDITKANRSLNNLKKKVKPDRSVCRNFELYAHQVAQWTADSGTQKKQPYDAYSGSETTTCVDLGTITQCSSY